MKNFVFILSFVFVLLLPNGSFASTDDSGLFDENLTSFFDETKEVLNTSDVVKEDTIVIVIITDDTIIIIVIQ